MHYQEVCSGLYCWSFLSIFPFDSLDGVLENPGTICRGVCISVGTIRRGKTVLDHYMLRKLEMSKTRLTSKDALIFWQLLFPIASPGHDGIDGNPRMPFYKPLSRFTNMYSVINRGRGGS